MWIHWVLANPNENTCLERFWMKLDTFLVLCNTLKQNGFLQSSRFVKIIEQVVAFCLLMAHNWTQRDVADRLQRSIHTINVYCRTACKAMCRLRKTIIQPTETRMLHQVVAQHGNYYPWFTMSNAWLLSLLGPAILTRHDNPTRTRHEISGFGSTLNGFGS
jgi:hypothetical protein